MKRLYFLVLLSASVLSSNIADATTTLPSDTLVQKASYSLSSRNAEAQTGKFKKLDLSLAYDENSKSYTLNITSEREINAYLEITDQDENVIVFKPMEIKNGSNVVSFIAEDGLQTLFRLSFSEPFAEKPAVFIIRVDGQDAETPVEAALR